VEANAREAFDLVLLDVQMPVMDGLVAAETINSHAARTGRRPLVAALTAQVMQKDQAPMREAGMKAVLRKPFEEKDLDALLAQAANRRREAQRELV
jgi:CheY-like chemotaxis protein